MLRILCRDVEHSMIVMLRCEKNVAIARFWLACLDPYFYALRKLIRTSRAAAIWVLYVVHSYAAVATQDRIYIIQSTGPLQLAHRRRRLLANARRGEAGLSSEVVAMPYLDAHLLFATGYFSVGTDVVDSDNECSVMSVGRCIIEKACFHCDAMFERQDKLPGCQA